MFKIGEEVIHIVKNIQHSNSSKKSRRLEYREIEVTCVIVEHENLKKRPEADLKYLMVKFSNGIRKYVSPESLRKKINNV